MIRIVIVTVLVMFSIRVEAQIVVDPTTASVNFDSASHLAIIPPGQVGAGGQVVTSYQGMVFSQGTNVVIGIPIITGPATAKTLATKGTLAPWKLTLEQLGLKNIPACLADPCPQYVITLIAIGPGGSSARSPASDVFALAPPKPTAVPVTPTNIRTVP